jgi:hypothetical protein
VSPSTLKETLKLLGVEVSRLIRTELGPFKLEGIKPGDTLELSLKNLNKVSTILKEMREQPDEEQPLTSDTLEKNQEEELGKRQKYFIKHKQELESKEQNETKRSLKESQKSFGKKREKTKYINQVQSQKSDHEMNNKKSDQVTNDPKSEDPEKKTESERKSKGEKMTKNNRRQSQSHSHNNPSKHNLKMNRTVQNNL